MQPRLAKARWIATNVLEGGGAKLYSRAADIWGNSYATQSILYFLLFDPAAATASDPRPSLPLQITAPAIGTILARSDWSANATWFTTRCSWEWINHESGDCGQFTLYRKGQWLTKEWSNYANDWMGYTPLYHNTLSLQNRQVPISPSIWDTTLQYGGQWNNGGSFGDPSVALSANDNWSYALFTMANLYNHPDWWTAAKNAKDVTTAARSVVWLNPDHVIVYDRANSAQPNEFKRFNLVLMNTPTITGQTASIVANGQALTVQVVMPPTATIREQHFWTTNPSQEVNTVSELDTSDDRLIIEDPSNPMSLRLLTVLQGTDAGVAADAASPIHSVAGAAFDGVTIKNTAVVFPSSIARPATATTYTVPATVTRHLITGLAPGGGYNVTLSTVANVTTVAVTTGSMYTADVGGVIGIGFPAPSNPTQGGVVAGQKLIPPPGGIGGGTGGDRPRFQRRRRERHRLARRQRQRRAVAHEQHAGDVVGRARQRADHLVDRRPARLRRRRHGRPVVARRERQHGDLVHERHGDRVIRKRRQHSDDVVGDRDRRLQRRRQGRHPLARRERQSRGLAHERCGRGRRRHGSAMCPRPGRWSAPATSTATAPATSCGATPAATPRSGSSRARRSRRPRASATFRPRGRWPAPATSTATTGATSSGATPAATPRSG